MNPATFVSVVVFTVLLSANAAAGSLRVEMEKSFISVDVSVFPSHSFTASLKDYEPAIAVAEDGQIESAVFRFLFEDLESNHAGRDKRMRKWMDIKDHPEVRFSLLEIREIDLGMLGVGELWMHGASREIAIPIAFERANGQATLRGEVRIDHRDWNLPAIKLMIFRVDPEISIRFEISGSLVEPSPI